MQRKNICFFFEYPCNFLFIAIVIYSLESCSFFYQTYEEIIPHASINSGFPCNALFAGLVDGRYTAWIPV